MPEKQDKEGKRKDAEQKEQEEQKQQKEQVRISVRHLVEFVLRKGDIDNRRGGAMEKEAMQLGSRIHRKIQRSMGASYHAEVPLKHVTEFDGFSLLVEGRADGILEEEDGIVIDEIKGILGELERIETPRPLHLAQARCYAFFYSFAQCLETVTVQITYCQMETEEIRRFRETWKQSDLEAWYQDVVGLYEKWARFELEWKEIRNPSIRKTAFPFAYRPGQKELVASVYHTIQKREELFIQAPTGVGKTMAAVFPAVRAVGEGLGEKIFYLTAKTITRTVAEQAFLTLTEQGLRMKVLTLTAKERICFCEETVCNPEACPYAKGHFDRVNDAVYELLVSQDQVDREGIEAHAKKHQVCPFEMALDLAIWVDAVICDYNYVFDPNAHLKRFFSEHTKEDYLFLIDEAHNLVDRGREMYSAAVYKEEFMEVRRLVKKEDPRLAKRLEKCNRFLLEWKKEGQACKVRDSVAAFSLKLMNVAGAVEEYLEECKKEEIRRPVLEFYFRIRNFLNISELLDEDYRIYTEGQEDGRFLLKLFCVNPAKNLQKYLDMGNGTIFFSATLLPMRYYKELLTTREECFAVNVQSPFPKENRLLLACRDVSTKYTRRGEEMYRRYARYIRDAVRLRKGNYLAFFPSYSFMEAVYDVFTTERHDRDEVECVIQSRRMDEPMRESFLQYFEEERNESLIGFCVMGGIFSEGIDLTDDRLIGVFLVGTGLPQVCTEREILKTCFDEKGMRGFDYAYLYPGMNKVQQAAGRVIRTENDKGIILLMDERFQEIRCRETFPKEWEDCCYGTAQTVNEKIREFWERQKEIPQKDQSS